jgi:hypothetical protein
LIPPGARTGIDERIGASAKLSSWYRTMTLENFYGKLHAGISTMDIQGR